VTDLMRHPEQRSRRLGPRGGGWHRGLLTGQEAA
jgi:hypothetical protein